jgi:DNA-binding MarR family transcriptional regulator
MNNVAKLPHNRSRLLPQYRLLDNVIFNVGKLANSYNRSATRFYLRHFGLSVPEIRVLNVIGHHHQISAAEIVDASVMDKGLVSRAVAKLVQEKLVTRAAHRSDGRRHTLTLTGSGRRLCAAVLAAKQHRHIRSIAGLTAAEVEQFSSLLARLQQEAEAMEREEIATETEESAA